MAINLVTYAAQTVTPQDDALIYETALMGSGLIYGGAVTIGSANVLHVAVGHGAICGRKFTIEATDISVALTSSGTELGRLYIHMDLADTDEPISFKVETGASLTPVVQNSDVNINNGVYEINLATFDVDTSTISNLVNVAPTIGSAVGAVSGASGDSDGQVKLSVTKSGSTTNTNVDVTGWDKLAGQWTSTVSCALGATSASFTNPYNTTSVAVEAFIENSSGTPVGYTTMTTTASTVTLAFDALEEAADIKLLIRDLS